MSVQSYPAHSFNAIDAAALDGELVTITTHPHFLHWEKTYAEMRVTFTPGDMHIRVGRDGIRAEPLEIYFEEINIVTVHDEVPAEEK